MKFPDVAGSVVLLDRDGVINVDLPTGVSRLADFVLIPGSLAALISLSRAGVTLALVTNQAGIGRGTVSADVVAEMHRELAERVVAGGGRLDHFFVSTSADPLDPDRKPNPGLIYRAQAVLKFTPASTWLVGDDLRDVQAARAGGVRPALVLTGKGMATRDSLNTQATPPPIPEFADLAAFSSALLHGDLA